jgi:lipoprotein-anchoring transpeptidase ErfK/SrfK
MSLPKVFLIVSFALFSLIGGIALCKKKSSRPAEKVHVVAQEEVDLSRLAVESVQSLPEAPFTETLSKDPVVECAHEEEKPVVIEHEPEENGLSALFVKGTACPIVETITYKRRAPWKTRGPAWLVDYANHYKTSLDFIYASLNGGRDFKQVTVSDGARFNVLRNDIDFRFHLIVSLSACRLRLYYVIPEQKKAVFLKSYSVCLGKKDSSKSSECLTPLGMYQLGEKTATFRPKMTGMHKGKKIELIQVFGGYWMPFEKTIGECTEPARGFGIHGTPILRDANSGALKEDNSSLGQYESDGCIRLAGKDIQELFAVVSTHKTYVELVPSFDQSRLLQGEIVKEEST